LESVPGTIFQNGALKLSLKTRSVHLLVLEPVR